jgi:hypothetical protein
MPISPLKWVVLLIRFVQSLLLTQLLYTAVLRVNGWRLLSVWVRSSISLFFSSFLTDFRKAFPLWAGPVIWSVVTPTLNGTLICGPSPHNGLSLSLGSFCVTRADQTWSKDLWDAGKFNFLYVYTYIRAAAAAAGCRARRRPFSILYIKRGGNMQGCATDAILPITLFSLSSEIQTRQKSIQKKKRGGGKRHNFLYN